jgi:selenide,water dikinase
VKRLTEFSHGAGCGCKLAPAALADVMSKLVPAEHADLLVGTVTGDDAAVFRLDDTRALIATTDFFTPLVDDARTWGRIAATNAISDVYAMGGRPLLALNLVCWPIDALPVEVLGEVLAGADDVARDAGFLIAGGHSIDDPEPKFGLAVIGEVDPRRLLTNTGLVPGQELVLTKPLGVGIVTTAVKRDVAPPVLVESAIASMTRTNADACRVALDAGASGATDVTGFGLLGHLGRMATESRVDVTVRVDDVPLLDGVRELAAEGVVPGGTHRNLAWIGEQVVRDGATDLDLLLLADPQTSGGLVFGVDAGASDGVVSRLQESGHDAAVVGAVEQRGSGRLRLV